MDRDAVDALLDTIDGALRDYGTSSDAMRWTPDADRVQADRGWVDDGHPTRLGTMSGLRHIIGMALPASVIASAFEQPMREVDRLTYATASAFLESAARASQQLAQNLANSRICVSMPTRAWVNHVIQGHPATEMVVTTAVDETHFWRSDHATVRITAMSRKWGKRVARTYESRVASARRRRITAQCRIV
ncbi:MAG TPA: hypothetical protein VIS06_16265, partial [Mycobacteriales bacterium]